MHLPPKLKIHGTLLNRIYITDIKLDTQSSKTVTSFCLLMCNEVKVLHLLNLHLNLKKSGTLSLNSLSCSVAIKA